MRFQPDSRQRNTFHWLCNNMLNAHQAALLLFIQFINWAKKNRQRQAKMKEENKARRRNEMSMFSLWHFWEQLWVRLCVAYIIHCLHVCMGWKYLHRSLRSYTAHTVPLISSTPKFSVRAMREMPRWNNIYFRRFWVLILNTAVRRSTRSVIYLSVW